MTKAPDNPVKTLAMFVGYHVERRAPLALAISTVLLAGGGAVLTANLAVGVPMVVVGAGIPGLQQYWTRKSDSADDVAAAREKLLLEQELQPLLEYAATATNHPRAERRKDAEKAAARAVAGLRNVFTTVRGVRVVVFVVSADGQRMCPLQPGGRQDRPGPFVRGTPRGDKAFEVLEDPRKNFIIVPDLDKAAPEEWEGTGEGYRTFISAPIRSQEDGYGLLTIDAPDPGSLDDRHASTVALFAAALGVLYAEAARGGGGDVHS